MRGGKGSLSPELEVGSWELGIPKARRVIPKQRTNCGWAGEAVSRRDEEAMRASSTRTDKENARRPVRPAGSGGTRLLSLLRLLDDAGHRRRRRRLEIRRVALAAIDTLFWNQPSSYPGSCFTEGMRVEPVMLLKAE